MSLATRLLPAAVRRTLLRTAAGRRYEAMQRQRRPEGLLDLSVERRRAKDLEGVARAVSRLLSSSLYALPREVVDLVATSLPIAAGDTVTHQHVTARLTEAVESLPPSAATGSGWLWFERLTLAHGFFAVSGTVRQLALRRINEEAHQLTGPDHRLRAALAALDVDDVDAAARYHDELMDLVESPLGSSRSDLVESLDDLGHYLAVRSKGRLGGRKLASAEADHAWRNLLDSRSIAVVGPAPLDESKAGDIDSCDVVVRINFRGEVHLADKDLVGTRTNVSYYNVQGCRLLASLSDRSFLEELSFAVFKPEAPWQQLQLPGRCRTLHGIRRLLLSGTPNLVPLILFDLLHASPSVIKVFGATFFASEKAYRPGYRRARIQRDGRRTHVGLMNETGTAYDLCASFAKHVPLHQLHIVKNLSRAGLIEPDRACRAVLNLRDAEYLSILDRNYGIPGL